MISEENIWILDWKEVKVTRIRNIQWLTVLLKKKPVVKSIISLGQSARVEIFSQFCNTKAKRVIQHGGGVLVVNVWTGENKERCPAEHLRRTGTDLQKACNVATWKVVAEWEIICPNKTVKQDLRSFFPPLFRFGEKSLYLKWSISQLIKFDNDNIKTYHTFSSY